MAEKLQVKDWGFIVNGASVCIRSFITFSLKIWIYLSHKIYKIEDNKSKTSFFRHKQKKYVNHEDS